MYGLDGNVAIVTGASRERGIGFAIARRLAAEGARVVLAGRVLWLDCRDSFYQHELRQPCARQRPV